MEDRLHKGVGIAAQAGRLVHEEQVELCGELDLDGGTCGVGARLLVKICVEGCVEDVGSDLLAVHAQSVPGTFGGTPTSDPRRLPDTVQLRARVLAPSTLAPMYDPHHQALRAAARRSRMSLLGAIALTGAIVGGVSVWPGQHQERSSWERRAIQHEFWVGVATGEAVSHPRLDRLAREIRQMVGDERGDPGLQRLDVIRGGLDSDEQPLYDGVTSILETQVFEGGRYQDDHIHASHESADVGALTPAFEAKVWNVLTGELDAVSSPPGEAPGWPWPAPETIASIGVILLGVATGVRRGLERNRALPVRGSVPGTRLLELELACTRPGESARRWWAARAAARAATERAARTAAVLTGSGGSAVIEARAYLTELEGLVQTPVVAAKVAAVRQICEELEAVPRALAGEAAQHRASEIVAAVEVLREDVHAARSAQRSLWETPQPASTATREAERGVRE